MLGMVDFSLIPSYFIDEASLYHGAGSVGVSGGGLGGAITLGTKPLGESGAGVHFIQGISSFDTYDEFLRFTYGTRKFESSTRVCYVTSDNDFKYRNYDKYEQIDGQWVYPMERNKNCIVPRFSLVAGVLLSARRAESLRAGGLGHRFAARHPDADGGLQGGGTGPLDAGRDDACARSPRGTGATTG